MKIYQFNVSQQLPISIQEAWDFFSEPENLSSITPDDMSFQILDCTSGKMHEGMIIQYRVQPFPFLKVKWVTAITYVHEKNKFIDEQRFGPFRFWHHEHQFKEVEGGTKMTDIIHYAVPFSVIGRFAHKLLIRKRLEDIFLFRRKKLMDYFGKDRNK